jgi:glyceraldehyde 3-phosphate dehydrogenase
VRVAINGLGRIGRLVLKIALEKKLNIVAVNNLGESKDVAYLLVHDSVYGRSRKKIRASKNLISIDGKKILYFSEPDPGKLPWKKLKVDIVLECTGCFTHRKGAERHLKAGAKRVLLSAPSDDSDVTISPGVNDKALKKTHKIISMASCTTNCLAPVANVLDDKFGIKQGFLTTVHAYTASQHIVDGYDKKVRRGRAGAINIIPTTTGATKAVVKVMPKLKGKLRGIAMRVPVASGSIIDFVVQLKKKASEREINNAFKKASLGKLKGILKCSEEELVSSDVIGDSHSAVVDSLSTKVMGNTVKILAWYDNEYGYSSRLVEMAKGLSGRR